MCICFAWMASVNYSDVHVHGPVMCPVVEGD